MLRTDFTRVFILCEGSEGEKAITRVNAYGESKGV